MFFVYLQGDRGEDSTVNGGPVSGLLISPLCMQKCIMDADFGIETSSVNVS